MRVCERVCRERVCRERVCCERVCHERKSQISDILITKA